MQSNTFNIIADPASSINANQFLTPVVNDSQFPSVDEDPFHQPLQWQPGAHCEDASSRSYVDTPWLPQDSLSFAPSNNLDFATQDHLTLNPFRSSDTVCRNVDLFPPSIPTRSIADDLERLNRHANEITQRQANQIFGDFSQQIDGAYKPPSPCSYCQQHHLHCLILRTDPANPNPVTSCASCVALFRECSMAQGSKRLPSEFETIFPAMGHLHGVVEERYDGTHLTSVSGRGGIQIPTNTRKQMSRRSVRPLKDWISTHQNYPFPSPADKLMLEVESSLTKAQINNWFANARRRQKRTTFTSPPLLSTRDRRLSDTDGRLLAMNPMERWENSPPESEPAELSAVATAAGNVLPSSRGRDYASYISAHSQVSSHSSRSATSFSSGLSDISNGSWASLRSDRSYSSVQFSKRRSRKRSAQFKTKTTPATDNGCIHECTFCGESISTRYGWQRHEQSIHLPIERWVCSLESFLVTWPMNGQSPLCLFCHERSPTAEHLANHDAEICRERPPEERTFTRKDHLRQHLRKYQGCVNLSSVDWILDSWKEDNPDFQSRCGFCGVRFYKWKERSSHLSLHFQQGARMKDWTGDYGFDEKSQRLLMGAVYFNAKSKMIV